MHLHQITLAGFNNFMSKPIIKNVIFIDVDIDNIDIVIDI